MLLLRNLQALLVVICAIEHFRESVGYALKGNFSLSSVEPLPFTRILNEFKSFGVKEPRSVGCHSPQQINWNTSTLSLTDALTEFRCAIITGIQFKITDNQTLCGIRWFLLDKGNDTNTEYIWHIPNSALNTKWVPSRSCLKGESVSAFFPPNILADDLPKEFSVTCQRFDYGVKTHSFTSRLGRISKQFKANHLLQKQSALVFSGRKKKMACKTTKTRQRPPSARIEQNKDIFKQKLLQMMNMFKNMKCAPEPSKVGEKDFVTVDMYDNNSPPHTYKADDKAKSLMTSTQVIHQTSPEQEPTASITLSDDKGKEIQTSEIKYRKCQRPFDDRQGHCPKKMTVTLASEAMGKGESPKYRELVVNHLKLDGYQNGHFLAKSLGGSGAHELNLLPIVAEINKIMGQVEKFVKGKVSKHGSGEYEVEVIDDFRDELGVEVPNRIQITYTIKGQQCRVTLKNNKTCDFLDPPCVTVDKSCPAELNPFRKGIGKVFKQQLKYYKVSRQIIIETNNYNYS